MIEYAGRDKFGPLMVGTGDAADTRCDGCGAPVGVAVQWDDLAGGMDELASSGKAGPDTLGNMLVRGNPNPTVGVTCGCYATMHRQFAHITDHYKGGSK